MLVDRSISEEYLDRKFKNELVVANKKQLKELCEYANDKFGISSRNFMDYITGRKGIVEATEFELYVMLKSIKEIDKNAHIPFDKWFSKKEIQTFDFSKFEKDEIKFPIEFDMIKIADDQWIGMIDINMLQKLCNAQMINYNPDTQRSMQKVIKNGNEAYIVNVNKRAVNQIKNSFEENTFISNTITLNIPENSNAKFYYDNKRKKLVINELKAFDINDGYHRFLAILKYKLNNPNWNFPMELRVTWFDILKSQRFIYQEDQKTKMKKVDSDSYNVYAVENIIANKINENPLCNIHGLIGKHDKKINAAELARIIKILYLPAYFNKEESIKLSMEISKEISNKFNILTEADENFINMQYDNASLRIILSGFVYYKDSDYKIMVESIKKALDNKNALDNKYYTVLFSKSVHKKIIDVVFK